MEVNLKSTAHVDESMRMPPHQLPPHQPPNIKDKKKETIAKINEMMKVLGQRYKSSHPIPKKRDFLDTKPIVIDRRLHSILEVDETYHYDHSITKYESSR